LFLLLFLIIAILTSLRWNFNVVLIFILFPLYWAFIHLFISHLDFSLVNFLSSSFSHFFFELLILWEFNFLSSL
jgi:hypothetical protein